MDHKSNREGEGVGPNNQAWKLPTFFILGDLSRPFLGSRVRVRVSDLSRISVRVRAGVRVRARKMLRE